MKDLTPLEKEVYNRIVNKVFVIPETISDSTKIVFEKAAIEAAALCSNKIEQAFLAGRSKQSWDSFLKESNLPIPIKKCHCEPSEKIEVPEKSDNTKEFLKLFSGQTLDDDMDLSLAKAAAALCSEKIRRAIELAREKMSNDSKTFSGFMGQQFYKYTPDEIMQKLSE